MRKERISSAQNTCKKVRTPMFENNRNTRNEDENVTLVEKQKLISSGKIK